MYDVAGQFALNYDLNRRAPVKFSSYPLRVPECNAAQAYPPHGKEAEVSSPGLRAAVPPQQCIKWGTIERNHLLGPEGHVDS